MDGARNYRGGLRGGYRGLRYPGFGSFNLDLVKVVFLSAWLGCGWGLYHLGQ